MSLTGPQISTSEGKWTSKEHLGCGLKDPVAQVPCFIFSKLPLIPAALCCVWLGIGYGRQPAGECVAWMGNPQVSSVSCTSQFPMCP